MNKSQPGRAGKENDLIITKSRKDEITKQTT